MLVATKCDRKAVRQRSLLQPEEFCAEEKLPPPVMFSSSNHEENTQIYKTLAEVASRPSPTLNKSFKSEGKLKFCLKFGAFCLLAGAAGYGIYRYLNSENIKIADIAKNITVKKA